MSKNLLNIYTGFIVTVLLSTFASAQVKQKDSSVKDAYVISAKAGGVNYVEGKVNIARANGRSDLLLKSDSVEVGDKVSTGANGKAEILLNPGSYIRLAENTNFEFETTSLDDLQIIVSRGNAMIEAITTDEFKVAVNTPKGRFFVVKSGIYRIDVANDGTGRIIVWKGKAQIDNFDSTEVKAGRAAIIDGGQLEIVKFDRDDKDALEAWSKVRAKELAKINSRLQGKDLRNSLLNSFNRSGWNMYDSYGLWVLDSISASYCFLPFGYGWSSPYGYGFGRDIWRYRLPYYIYQPPTQTIVRNSGDGIVPATEIQRRRRMTDDLSGSTPPFRRLERDFRSSPVDQNNDFSPSFSMPSRQVAPAPVVSLPTRAPSSRSIRIDQ